MSKQTFTRNEVFTLINWIAEVLTSKTAEERQCSSYALDVYNIAGQWGLFDTHHEAIAAGQRFEQLLEDKEDDTP